MKVRSIMTREVVRIHAEAHLGDALKLMDEEDVRHLPVIDHEGETERLVGVISDRDLLIATGWLPARVIESRGGRAEQHRDHRVREVMQPAITFGPDDLVSSVSELMMMQHVGCVPIVEHDQLVGIVTQGDILDAYHDLLEAGTEVPLVSSFMSETPKTLDMNATLAEAETLCAGLGIRHVPVLHMDRVIGIVSDRDLRKARGRGRKDDFPVGDLMTQHILEVNSGAPLSEAAQAMSTHKISSLPVVADGRLVGILTVSDVLEHCVSVLGDSAR